MGSIFHQKLQVFGCLTSLTQPAQPAQKLIQGKIGRVGENVKVNPQALLAIPGMMVSPDQCFFEVEQTTRFLNGTLP